MDYNIDFKNYNTISSSVKNQIQQVCDIWVKYLKDDLIGMYIHGSLALGYFIEETSDIDILIISQRHIQRDERLKIAKDIINIDIKPCHLEMSAIYIHDINPWQYPTPCQFHYSDYWTKRYIDVLNGDLDSIFIIDNDFKDEDIASYVHLLNQSGICVYGKPIKDVLPTIPEKDFWSCLCSDVDDYDFHAYNPRYFVSNILILGRKLSYKIEKRILSKYEGGLWTLNYVPQQYKYIIDHAIKAWYKGEKIIDYKPEDVENLRKFLIDKIKE